MTEEFRTESDSMGELKVPATALWGAQTQRAVQNFPVSGLPMPIAFIRALGLIKAAAAQVNADLGLLDAERADAIKAAARRVAAGEFNDQFPIDVFQTGSGTSSNMNANEVIAHIANREGGLRIHPNDHVNMGQSSNDVVPTAIQVSACLLATEKLRRAQDNQRLITMLVRKAGVDVEIAENGRIAVDKTVAQEEENTMLATSARRSASKSVRVPVTLTS